MLTNDDVIQIVTDLIEKCHSDAPHDLGRTIWTSLTDPDTNARDLTAIAVTAITFAAVWLDESGLGVEPMLEDLRFNSTWRDLTSRMTAEPGERDG